MKAPQVSLEVTHVCASVLADVDASIVIVKVLPLVEKELIRELQLPLESSARLFTAMKATDLSPAVSKSVLPTLGTAVKSREAAVRQGAVTLSGALGPRVVDSGADRKAVSDLGSELKSSRYVYQRVAV